MTLRQRGYHNARLRVPMSWTNRVPPGVTLLFLAPLMGELVSGHQSLFQFVNPLTFVLLALPYGFGALVCRELMVRWRRGWLALLLLALAYGLYEEGLVARSIWDPQWAELGAIGSYSFWRGVTWTYAAVLLHFHVAVSIGGSVMIAHLLYPVRRGERWLSSPQLAWCVVGLALWMPALMLLHPFRPPMAAVAVAVVSIAALVLLARRLPDPPRLARPQRSMAPIWYGLLGALNTAVVFVVVFVLPESAQPWLPPWPVSLGVVLLVDAVSAWLVLWWSGGGMRWNDRHKLALVTGVLAFFIVLDAVQDFDEQFGGRVFVAALTAFALWRLHRATVRRLTSDPVRPAART